MGVGMPAELKLQEFGSQVWNAFGSPPYHVGSSMPAVNKDGWRDVDVRMILSDEDWVAWGLGDPHSPNGKWVALCWAFSEMGKSITGLPIDFQIQQQTRANKVYGGEGRAALGIVALRRREPEVT